MHARVRAVGPSTLPTALLPAVDVGGNKHNASLLLLESSVGALGSTRTLRDQKAVLNALEATSQWADTRGFRPTQRCRRLGRKHDAPAKLINVLSFVPRYLLLRGHRPRLLPQMLVAPVTPD